jgi:hypothetical protein
MDPVDETIVLKSELAWLRSVAVAAHAVCTEPLPDWRARLVTHLREKPACVTWLRGNVE